MQNTSYEKWDPLISIYSNFNTGVQKNVFVSVERQKKAEMYSTQGKVKASVSKWSESIEFRIGWINRLS